MLERERSGRRPFEAIIFIQDLCDKVFGQTCSGSLAVNDRECFNTRATCAAPADYGLVEGGLPLHFCRPNDELPDDGNYWFPFLVSAKVKPGQINPGAGNRNIAASGNRAEISIVLDDHPHTDRIVDPYVDQRKARIPTYDPLSKATFWTKWRARNPYYLNRFVQHISGYIVDGQIVDSVTRTFVTTGFTGPDSNGRVTIRGQDVLSLVTGRKVKAPAASPGKLASDIDEDSTELTLTPEGIGDLHYATKGFARISSEVVTFTRVGDVVTITERAVRTEIDSHSGGDTFQQCLSIESKTVAEVMEILLNVEGGIPLEFLDIAGWQAETTSYLPRLYSTLITEPTSVDQLVNEFSETAFFYPWVDERVDKVKLRAVRPVEGDTVYELTQSRHLVKNTVQIRDRADELLTQVIVNYGQRDPTRPLDDHSNYSASEVVPDFDLAGPTRNRGDRIKVVNSRWITTQNAGAAIELGTRLLSRYGQIPREITFELDAKDREVWVGAFTQITHRKSVDAMGDIQPLNFQVMSASESRLGSRFSYKAQTFTFEREPEPGVYEIPVSNDQLNLNLREWMESVLAVDPQPGDEFNFKIRNGVIIGSASTVLSSITRGTWPTGVIVRLTIEAGGAIIGAGGRGGRGATGTRRYNANGTISIIANSPAQTGQSGGPAINAWGGALLINNLGLIAGGGGGGGGGGLGVAGARYVLMGATFLYLQLVSGSGGGAGAGSVPANGGASGDTPVAQVPGGDSTNSDILVGNAGSPSSETAPGPGGSRVRAPDIPRLDGSTRPGAYNGAGGGGGFPGQNGFGGQAGGWAVTSTSGAQAGAAGFALINSSGVQWENQGDVRGNIHNLRNLE